MTLLESITELQQAERLIRAVATDLEYEAMREGIDTNGASPLYQAWCLLPSCNGAIQYLRQAEKERER